MNNDRGQSLISKYVWVIDTIYKAHRISFKELNHRWLCDDISRGVDIPKRTFDNWRCAIWDLFGINIENENRGEYRYYIANEGDIHGNGLRSWLFNTLCVSNALSSCQGINDRILLENVPSGQSNLQTVLEAMKENRVLKSPTTATGKRRNTTSTCSPTASSSSVSAGTWWLAVPIRIITRKDRASMPLTA